MNILKSKVKKIKTTDIMEYLFATALILNAQSMWSKLANVQVWFSWITLVVLWISVIGLLLSKRNYKSLSLKKKTLVIWIAIVGYLLVFLLVRPSSIKTLLQLYMAIFAICLLVLETNDIRGILLKYKTLMLAIALISLLFWVFGSILHLIEPTGKVESIWNGTGANIYVNSYYNLYFEFQKSNISLASGYRNIAIFCEAPMAAFNFCVAFLVELFCEEKFSKRNLTLLCIAIISTISMTGYVTVIVGITMKYFITNPKHKIFKVVKILIVPVFLIAITVFAMSTFELKAGTGSGMVRLNDFSVGFEVWKKNKLFGVGYGNYDEIKAMMPAWRMSNTGFSNSIMLLLAYGGVYVGFAYIFSFIRGILDSLKMHKYNKMAFIMLFVFMFLITNVPFIYLSVLFVVSFWKKDTEISSS